jgi:hypothetical protein
MSYPRKSIISAMATPEQERARLVGVYTVMSDEELRKVAQSGDELTSIAQEALAAEAARRGLDLTAPAHELPSEPAEPEVLLPPSEEERMRVANLYSAMSDEELGQLADSAFELSDEAHLALAAEISRRGLSLRLASDPGIDVYEKNELVTLRQFRDLPEALLARGSLESAGIESQLVDDNMIRLDWFYSNLLGGIKLKVQVEDVEAAQEILSLPIPEIIEVESVGSYTQPKCPHCQSLDVSFRELNKLFSFGSAYVGVPVPVYRKAWTCHACGREWEGQDVTAYGQDSEA